MTPVSSAETRLRVFLADDHAVVRDGLRLLLEAESDLTVVGEAADGETAVAEVLALATAGALDLVVLDIAMPRLNGLEALRRIKLDWPRLPVLILTGYASEPYLFQVVAAGGAGYVLKGAETARILEAVRQAATGTVFLYPTMEARLLTDALHRARGDDRRRRAAFLSLTGREREVLGQVALGYTSQEIGERLGMATKTAETHRSHIVGKLGLRTRAALVAYALREGYLTLSEDPVEEV